MSSKSKDKTEKTKGGVLVTLPLEIKHVDALYAVINQSAPQNLLPLEKTPPGTPLVIVQAALWQFNELRKIIDVPRNPPPDGFDGEEVFTHDEWRKKHNLSEHFFPRKEKLVFFIPHNVKGVLRHFLSRMPNVLPLGVHLSHWDAIVEAFRLKQWAKVWGTEKALADPDGESVDFDADEGEGEGEADGDDTESEGDGDDEGEEAEGA